jgi:hypothetical protein
LRPPIRSPTSHASPERPVPQWRRTDR